MRTPLRPVDGTGVPDGIVPLLGYREWAIQLEPDGRPTLRSLFHPTLWPPDRPLSAICLRPLIWHGRGDLAHTGVPDVSCECGIYAFREPDFDTLRGAKGPKARGVVRGWGRFVLGTSGWRCELAAIAAILEDREDPAMSFELGRGYRVPVLDSVEPDAVNELRPAVGF